MVHIKKVEIYGFKSFGYKNTVVPMEKGVVCVTGPNGSGKSNILDAIVFALGENSPKVLRVPKLHSLFHDQSEGRVHKLVRTSVSFDNTERGIPFDSNIVTITREMPFQGESQYYLNGKKVTKTTITDLLDMVVATPNKLNVVQQGMIMRLAELNSEERRGIIEDIVGLSYFDEKKAGAMKQLEEADRRLEVAMARMGEIRKRIDDLEGERNDQLRFHYLERDIKHIKATKFSISILEIRKRLQSQNMVSEQGSVEIENVGKQLETIKKELSLLEGEKSNFLKKVDVYSRAKAEVDSGISNVIMRFEQLKASIRSSEQRVKQIGQNIPMLLKERDLMKKRTDIINPKLKESNSQLTVSEEGKRKILAEIQVLNSELKDLHSRQSEVNEQKTNFQEQLKGLESIQGKNSIELSTNVERQKINVEKLQTNTNREQSINDEQKTLSILIAKLLKLKSEELQKIDYNDQEIRKIDTKKVNIEQQIESTSLLQEKAGSAAVQYKTKIKMVKNIQHEDYAIAMLLQYAKEFGILGTFMQLVKWENYYERAVIAVASLWLKAIVVKDVKKMLKMVDHAREMKFPRLRIIPLDIATNQNVVNIPASNGVRGLLSDFVSSYEAPNLVNFVFGETILVDNTHIAYHLSKEGWKTVTFEGELFEPKANAVILDLNSKITNLTKTILLGESIESLISSIDMLRQLISRKKDELNDITLELKQVEESKAEVIRSITAIDSQIENSQGLLQQHTRSSEIIQERIKSIIDLGSETTNKIEKQEAEQKTMNFKITEIQNKLEGIDEQRVDKNIRVVDLQKIEMVRTIESLENEIREKLTLISSQKGEIESLSKKIGDIVHNFNIIKEEAVEKSHSIKENKKELQNVQNELKAFRDREQQIIDTSGNSVRILQEYESKIKLVSEEERKIYKQMSTIEKNIALNRKEITDLTINEKSLMQELMEYGYSEPLEGYNVVIEVAELIKEYNNVRSSINQLADKTYVQVIEGYRGMSFRKNQLESERNSIVRFIEDIERQKKQVFMEAFDKINKDVRYMFSTMTGGEGSAWLELENPDDVFITGIMFIAQFPMKPPRESTSLSGGEKTIAATTFLLALQSLKPSPYYLFDEIDAHLDAQNTERLSKIVVEKSKSSQMIVVTLKDAIVAKAKMVHGVYPRSGISQVIKYNPSTMPVTS